MTCNWRNILLDKDQSIRDALKIINSESLRIALVVSKDYRLLGVVTDGDIRRALLNDIGIDHKVNQIMSSNPFTAQIGTPRTELLNLMKKEKVLAIPLLDGAKIVGLETLENVDLVTQKLNPVFIMAGGFGTRLKPLTDNCPKPMLKVGDKPMLELMVDRFVALGFSNFYISTHYLPEIIYEYFGDGSKWNISISYVNEETPLGTGGALSLLPADIGDLPIIMINGDILTTVDFRRLLNFHEKHDSIATLSVRDYEYQVPFGVVNGDGKKIISMMEKPTYTMFVNAGIYVINPAVLEKIQKGVHVDMPTLVKSWVDSQHNVMMFPIHEYWLDIGRIEDYHRAQDDILSMDF